MRAAAGMMGQSSSERRKLQPMVRRHRRPRGVCADSNSCGVRSGVHFMAAGVQRGVCTCSASGRNTF